MKIMMHLYQNGDMEISRREEKYYDAEEVLYSENYFSQVRDHDYHRQMDLYKKYQDVVESLDKLCKMAGKERPNTEKTRGSVVKEVEFMAFTPGSFSTGGYLADSLDRNHLESNLCEITKVLIGEIRQLKEEVGSTLENITF